MISPICGIFAPHMLPLSLPWYHHSVGYLHCICCLCPFHGITTLWDICAAYAALVISMVSPLCGIFAPHMLPLSFPWYHHSVGYLRRICCPCHFHGITTVGYLCRICCLCLFHDITHLSDICAACAALVSSMVLPLCGIFAPDVLPLSLPSYHYSVGYLRGCAALVKIDIFLFLNRNMYVLEGPLRSASKEQPHYVFMEKLNEKKSRGTTFPTKPHVSPTKAKISLRIRTL